MAWDGTIWTGVDSLRLVAFYQPLSEIIAATNERCQAADVATLDTDIRLHSPYDICSAIQTKITALIPDYVNHTDNAGNWDGQTSIPNWTEADILTAIGAGSRLSPDRLYVAAEWVYQQYQILNLLRWGQGDIAFLWGLGQTVKYEYYRDMYYENGSWDPVMYMNALIYLNGTLYTDRDELSLDTDAWFYPDSANSPYHFNKATGYLQYMDYVGAVESRIRCYNSKKGEREVWNEHYGLVETTYYRKDIMRSAISFTAPHTGDYDFYLLYTSDEEDTINYYPTSGLQRCVADQTITEGDTFTDTINYFGTEISVDEASDIYDYTPELPPPPPPEPPKSEHDTSTSTTLKKSGIFSDERYVAKYNFTYKNW